MVKVLILEDEAYTRRFIKKIVLESPLVSQILDTPSGNEAINLANEYQPDIALLDIELDANEKLNGLEVAKIIHKVSPKTKFVFITGYSKYAVDSFEVHPYDYILKPIKIAKLSGLINELASKAQTKKNNILLNKRLIVKNKKETVFISIDDILFVEKKNKNTFIYDNKNVYHVHQNLAELERELGDGFFRVHKSYIVNKNKIYKIIDIGNRSYKIEFVDTNKTAFMSRNKFDELKKEIISSF